MLNFFFLKKKKKKTPGDIIISHLCTKNLQDKIYSSWNKECNERAGTRYGSWDTEWETEFFVILGNFLSFYPPNNPKNQNFEKIKKASGDVTILHMSIKNHNHMMFTSWGMETDRHNCLSFWTNFCPFTPILTLKIKIWKCKKTWICYTFTNVYHKWRSYDVELLRYQAQWTRFLSFWAIFCTLTLLQIKIYN